MVYAKFGGQTKCLMGNSKIENGSLDKNSALLLRARSNTISRYEVTADREPKTPSVDINSDSYVVKIRRVMCPNFRDEPTYMWLEYVRPRNSKKGKSTETKKTWVLIMLMLMKGMYAVN